MAMGTTGNTPDRHPNIVAILGWFDNTDGHLRAGGPEQVNNLCRQLAEDMVMLLGDGPELTAGLCKLLEAKDCFVRAAL